MTGLDTNVLIRYFVEDDEVQSRRVNQLFGVHRRAGEPLYVSCIVLCELVWAMRSTYSKPRGEIAKLLSELLDTDLFRIEEENAVRRALDQFKAGKSDFADCLIGRLNLDRRCRVTVSFDRVLKNVPGFSVL
jgi:predicted nucleic-acid-binding protein